MIRIIIIIIIVFLTNKTFAQNKPLSLDGSYYRLDNIDSLNNYSLDSLKGELQYFGIYNDSISGFIFPIMLYKKYDDWTKDNLFNFIKNDSILIDHIEAKGILINCNGSMYSDLVFFKRDLMNYDNIMPIDLTLRVQIVIKVDSLLLNNKLFKKDNTGRIFQRFTGY